MRNKETITLPLSQGIAEKYEQLYRKHASYVCPELQVRAYNNVFVSHEGLCLRHFRLLPYSTFNIRTRYDRSFGWQYYKLVLEQYLVSTYGKSLEKIILDDDTNYALIHTKWANYSFWVTSSLVRLQMLYESGQDFTLLYPEEWDNIAYIQESLKAFPNLKVKRIPAGVHVQVKHLLLPEVRPFTACFNGRELQGVHDYFVQRIPQSNQAVSTPERVYVTRKRAKFRKVENEAEVVELVSRYGFEVVDFDDLSFWEQVWLMKNARAFISLHGAGFSNITFMNRNAVVVELINAAYAEMEYTFPFWHQAVTRGLHYEPLFCEPLERNAILLNAYQDKQQGEALVNQNVVVEVDKLERILNTSLGRL